ncbi:MAG: MBL fold metallo-hydrolase [Gammaproteobacteria bacterium]|nr:MBL fold metallo-hydrolase [Gammaproteobacteria bacterium]MDH3428878.1 MBL fold metallo-hydrolase [Gammaproteobacteria bacterium]MDH3432265.1 MBL fold metallo-hydrolase [Gammaproteobacteria bacterium]
MPERHAQTTKLNDGIVAVDTEYARPLQDASHLLVESGRAAIIDTGVNSSVPLLLDALMQLNLDPADVDFVFLTHVHLDHAGGAGSLMQQLPNAKCVLHPYGAPHMIDPTKLVAGAEVVYGKEKTRRIYGRIEPIDERRIVISGDEQWFDLNGRALQTIYTEGHARHHYVLNDPGSQGVFTGDSFGVSYREFDTANGEIVFPTTTPVQFDPHEAHKAVDRIMACEPEHCYLTHYSRVRNVDRLAAQMHEGIEAYVAIARKHEHAVNRIESIQKSIFEYYEQQLAEHGFSGDGDAIQAVLGIDIDLNAQGLEVWLERAK